MRILFGDLSQFVPDKWRVLRRVFRLFTHVPIKWWLQTGSRTIIVSQ